MKRVIEQARRAAQVAHERTEAFRAEQDALTDAFGALVRGVLPHLDLIATTYAIGTDSVRGVVIGNHLLRSNGDWFALGPANSQYGFVSAKSIEESDARRIIGVDVLALVLSQLFDRQIHGASSKRTEEAKVRARLYRAVASMLHGV